ncbi:MAG: hypothetical protein KDB04_01475, partial [Acidimicrobiales bacterium]|nr:hypothetical protein [Acidimicrobiales bacterium]
MGRFDDKVAIVTG